MTSYEFANRLRKVADVLAARAEFELPNYQSSLFLSLSYYDDKEGFLKAVRAIGSGQKKVQDDTLLFVPDGCELDLKINRSSVCRLVKEAVWACEPLLSDEEEAQVGV